jgi:hypothetical protein
MKAKHARCELGVCKGEHGNLSLFRRTQIHSHACRIRVAKTGGPPCRNSVHRVAIACSQRASVAKYTCGPRQASHVMSWGVAAWDLSMDLPRNPGHYGSSKKCAHVWPEARRLGEKRARQLGISTCRIWPVDFAAHLNDSE